MLNLKDETTLNTLLNSKDIKYTNDTGKITHIKLSTLTRLTRRDLDPAIGDLAWQSYYRRIISRQRYIIIHNNPFMPLYKQEWLITFVAVSFTIESQTKPKPTSENIRFERKFIALRIIIEWC